jgi:putative ABC transport system permease protein
MLEKIFSFFATNLDPKKLKDYFKFAWNNLVHKKVRSWLTLLGIFMGVMSVVALIGLGDGLKAAVSAQFGISSTEVITVQAGGIGAAGPPGSGVVNPLTQKDVDDIERLSSVENAIPRIIEEGKLEFNDIAGFGLAVNIPDGDDRKLVYDILELEAESGRLLKDGDNKKVLLGYNFGQTDSGFERAIKTGDSVLVEETRFEVVGIAEKKGSFIFDNMVVLNDEPIKAMMDNPDRVDVIAVKLKNKDLMPKAKEDIEEILRKNRDVDVGEEDFSVETPEAALSTVNDILTGIQIFIVMIAAISIIVGSIGIINTMTTSVLERKQQIGIMKAIGAKNSDIFFQFFFESGLMGLIGGGLGVIIGELIAFGGIVGINNFIGAETPFQINYILILGALFGSFLVGAISGIIPAMMASKENPVDALRD